MHPRKANSKAPCPPVRCLLTRKGSSTPPGATAPSFAAPPLRAAAFGPRPFWPPAASCAHAESSRLAQSALGHALRSLSLTHPTCHSPNWRAATPTRPQLQPIPIPLPLCQQRCWASPQSRGQATRLLLDGQSSPKLSAASSAAQRRPGWDCRGTCPKIYSVLPNSVTKHYLILLVLL